jgi:hypothetical protein
MEEMAAMTQKFQLMMVETVMAAMTQKFQLMMVETVMAAMVMAAMVMVETVMVEEMAAMEENNDLRSGYLIRKDLTINKQ